MLDNFNQLYFLYSSGRCRKRTTQNFCCVFPFVYRGRRYNRCTRIGSRRPWCATTPNYDVDKLFGYCGSRGKEFVAFDCKPFKLPSMPFVCQMCKMRWLQVSTNWLRLDLGRLFCRGRKFTHNSPFLELTTPVLLSQVKLTNNDRAM